MFYLKPPWGLAQIQDFCLLLAFLNDLNDKSFPWAVSSPQGRTALNREMEVKCNCSWAMCLAKYFFCVLNKTCLFSHTSRSVCSEIPACFAECSFAIHKKSDRMSSLLMNREALNWHSYCLLIIFTDRRGKLWRREDKWSITHCQGNCPGRHMKANHSSLIWTFRATWGEVGHS